MLPAYLLLDPTPPPQGGGPEPAHLALCGGLLVVVALLAVVFFLRRPPRHEQPRRVEPEAAPAGPAQPELVSVERPAKGVRPPHAEPAPPQPVSEARPATRGAVARAVAFTLNLLSRLVAFILAALFVATALLALLLFNVGWQLFDPGLYKRALAEQRIYEQAPALVAEQFRYQLAYVEKYAGLDLENMSTSPELEACLRRALGDESFSAIAGFEREPDDSEIERMRPCFAEYGQMESAGEAQGGEGGPPPGLASLTPADWEALLSRLIPTAWLQAQTESVIDQAFATLDSEGPAEPLTISLVALREHLAAGAVEEALVYVVRGRPPCTAEQLAVLASGPLQELPTCRPPEALLASLAEQGAQVLREAIAKIPDEADLTEAFRDAGESSEPPPPQDPSPFDASPRQVLRVFRAGLKLSPLLPAGLLLLVTLFGVRSRQGLLRWWGSVFLLVGLAGLGMALAAMPALDWAIASHVLDRLPGSMSPALAQVGLDVGRRILRAPVTWIGVEAAVIALVGAALLLAVVFVRPKPGKKST